MPALSVTLPSALVILGVLLLLGVIYYLGGVHAREGVLAAATLFVGWLTRSPVSALGNAPIPPPPPANPPVA
jgi:hypothetical protein